LTFAVEKWRDVEKEILQIIDRHWLEIAVNREKIHLDVDCATYRQMDDLGMLHVVTAREGGELAGYYVSIIRPHPHYRSTMFAFQDAFFVVPEHRRGTMGIDFVRFMEQAVKAAGAKNVVASTKTHFDLSPLFLRLGFKEVETQFQKWIGD
jgi:L-amino acid N-acyltransferase YncA